MPKALSIGLTPRQRRLLLTLAGLAGPLVVGLSLAVHPYRPNWIAYWILQWRDTLGGIALLLVGVVLIALPAMIANSRKHPGAAGITVLTVLLGWTFVGWVAALAWALNGAEKPKRVTIERA